MQRSLQTDGILAEDQRVDIVAKRNGGVAKLANAVERLKPAGEPDLHDALTERADVGDHVYVARADVGHAIDDPTERSLELGDLRLGFGRTRRVTVGQECRGLVRVVRL